MPILLGLVLVILLAVGANYISRLATKRILKQIES